MPWKFFCLLCHPFEQWCCCCQLWTTAWDVRCDCKNGRKSLLEKMWNVFDVHHRYLKWWQVCSYSYLTMCSFWKHSSPVTRVCTFMQTNLRSKCLNSGIVKRGVQTFCIHCSADWQKNKNLPWPTWSSNMLNQQLDTSTIHPICFCIVHTLKSETYRLDRLVIFIIILRYQIAHMHQIHLFPKGIAYNEKVFR